MRDFLDRVRCHGGGDFEEAVEAALAEANRDPRQPTRVLLIGDAPPHPEKKGQPLARHGGRIMETDWCTECAELARKGIPVYTFQASQAQSAPYAILHATTIQHCPDHLATP